MLVLSRKQEEEILIGNEIRVMVVGALRPGQSVRLGITAPRSEPIIRGELDQLPPLPPEDAEVPPR